jgi:hypothetical protein
MEGLLQGRHRVRRAGALVVAATLSAMWTVDLLSAPIDGASNLPDGTTVPAEALEDPASYSQPGSLGLGVPKGEGDKIVQTSSTNGIPSAALAAYQRAETVINAADKACNIPWQLVAAIGRVESDHGRYGGNSLDANGVSRPGIYGIALDGTRNTAEITDTDAGQFDNDTVYDRAVGPMQFIPSTWSVVGVDADGDAKRNPQDIDDAALAAAVYLCSGTDNLGTDAGRRTSVYRYNHSDDYVDLVLSIMDAYMSGDYTSVPNYTTSAITFTPDYSYTAPTGGNGGKNHGGKNTNTGGNNGGPTTGGNDGPTVTQPPTTPPPTETPADNDPIKNLQDKVTETVKEVTKPVTDLVNGLLGPLTSVQATLQCALKYPLAPVKQQECLDSYEL